VSLGAVLFDLDGTISDSGPIVSSLFAITAKEITGRDHTADEMMKYVGPPLAWTMMDLGAAEEEVPDHIAAYRARYDGVMTEAPLFDGMGDAIRRIADRVPIALATSKKTSGARCVIDAYGLTSVFTAICGGSEDGLRSDKDEIIGEALAQIGPVDGEIIMVGDRIYDIEGAAAHGLRTVLVSWGAGTADEHEMAWRSVSSAQELEELLLSL